MPVGEQQPQVHHRQRRSFDDQKTECRMLIRVRIKLKKTKNELWRSVFFWTGIQNAILYSQKYTPPHCFSCNFAGWLISLCVLPCPYKRVTILFVFIATPLESTTYCSHSLYETIVSTLTVLFFCRVTTPMHHGQVLTHVPCTWWRNMWNLSVIFTNWLGLLVVHPKVRETIFFS